MKVKSFTEPPRAFASYPLTDETGAPITLRIIGGTESAPIVEVQGIADRNEAERWRNKPIGTARSAITPDVSSDTLLARDLIGMEVVDATGNPIGIIDRVMNFGAGDILDIQFRDGTQEMFSFTEATFPNVDTLSRRITFEPPHILGANEEEPTSPPAGGGSTRGERKKFGKEADSTRNRKAMNRAEVLRKNPTDAEKKLWHQLRGGQLQGIKFRRQQSIGPYIVDFVAMNEKCIIELDGGQHATRTDHDVQRTTFLNHAGYRVMRYWNNDVLENIAGVLADIATAVGVSRAPSPTPSRKREGNLSSTEK